MRFVRWDPFRDLADMQLALNRMFSDGRGARTEASGCWEPVVDILEKGDDLIIRAELPGVAKDDIEVRVENGRLILSGERKRETSADDRVYRIERRHGRFRRSFALPKSVDASKISANCKDGVLQIVLPKMEEAKPKKVAIQAA